jgi:Mg2+-importing ATPase
MNLAASTRKTTPAPLAGIPLDQWFRELNAGPQGLSAVEAQERLLRYGPNDAMAREGLPLAVQFFMRFGNPLILILLFASALSAVAGDTTSLVIVIVIVSLSVTLDFVQELRARNVIDTLRQSVAPRATVLRDGAPRELSLEDIVPGDIVQLCAGDIVPADCRLVSVRDLFVNQALLTGEPYPVEKHVDEAAEDANCVFMGTSVVSGTASALVCRTGRGTRIGAMAAQLVHRRPPDAFEIGVRRFGFLILRITIFLVMFVLVTNVLFNRPLLESIMFSIALAVGLTPELLPMVVTVTLARGAIRLARLGVIAKRLPAIHDLGSMDTLCTDKTGTLTEAKIRVVGHIDAAGTECEKVLRLAHLNSMFETGLKSPLDEAILQSKKFDQETWTKIDEVPFDFERRRVSVLIDADGGRERLLIVKGAPEDVLAHSTHVELANGEIVELDDAARASTHAAFAKLGAEGLRALGIAYRSVGSGKTNATVGDEEDLYFAGFVAFLDPPKESAARAIAQLAALGVSVKILTGDSEQVTRHVCRDLGIAVSGTVVGSELVNLSDEALAARISEANLFCRVTPAQKQRILQALKRRGATVGFLGDGINDAPALHAADVGISVDSGADVAKAAADLVLLQRDLTVITEGVTEGRRTVENVTKYILMGSSSNFGNMFSMAGAALFLPFLPMLPVQVLLNNLLYDGSEIGVPFDRVDEEALQKPAQWSIKLIERFMLVLGPVSSVFDFLTFYVLLHLFDADAALFQTGWFVESLATQVLVVFIIRTRGPFWKTRPDPVLAWLCIAVVGAGLVIPWTPIGAWFGFVHPPASFYIFLVLAVGTYLALVEVVKRAFYRYLAPVDRG